MRRTHSDTVSPASTSARAVSDGEFRVTERGAGSSAPVKPHGKLVLSAGGLLARDRASSLPGSGRLPFRLTGIAPQCIDESSNDPTLVTDRDAPALAGARSRVGRGARDPHAVG